MYVMVAGLLFSNCVGVLGVLGSCNGVSLWCYECFAMALTNGCYGFLGGC